MSGLEMLGVTNHSISPKKLRPQGRRWIGTGTGLHWQSQYLNSRNPGKVPDRLVVLATLKLTWILNVTVLVQINDPTSSHLENPCLCGLERCLSCSEHRLLLQSLRAGFPTPTWWLQFWVIWLPLLTSASTAHKWHIYIHGYKHAYI